MFEPNPVFQTFNALCSHFKNKNRVRNLKKLLKHLIFFFEIS